jgi:hypothetical protein
MNAETIKTASISSIATFIVKDCHRQGKLVPPAARPYISAMICMDKISDSYGFDDGKSIVNYALCNLQNWRGENARMVKAHLKAIAKW